jgi:uncharacterized protein YegP (UPF0339 family)
MEFQVHRGHGPQPFRWIIVDGSDTLAQSEMLSDKSHALAIANRVKDRTWEYTFSSFKDTSGRWRWRITSGNTQKVVSSTGSFTNQWEADAERDRVQKNAPYAIVRDMT